MKFLKILLLCLLCIFSLNTFATSDNNNCGKLSVAITNNTNSTCHLVWEHLNHGYYTYSTFPPAFIPSGMTSMPVVLTQSTFGPSMELRYQCGNGKSITFQSQQDVCIFWAGKIHAKILSISNLNPQTFKREGSYLWSQHGSLQWILN